MSLRNTSNSYGSVAKFFHWVIFLLVLINVFGFFLDDLPEDWKGFSYNTHKLIGISILVLMSLRFLWRLSNPVPVLPPNLSLLAAFAARTVHYLLYLALIIMPLAGWIGSSAAGHHPHLGDISLAFPVAESEALADAAFAVHNFTAWVIIGLLTLHVLAALYHHFIRKDNVLVRMLPGSGS